MTEPEVRAVFDALALPFPDEEVKTLRKGGREMRYITARIARRRLDEVLGPANWEVDVQPADRWVKCTLTVTVWTGDRQRYVLQRSAIGGYPEMPSEEDRVKGGDSDAFKRACALFGVGSYLYGDDPVAVESRGGERPAPRRAAGASPGPAVHPRGRSAPPTTGGRGATSRNGKEFDPHRPPLRGDGFYRWCFTQAELRGLGKWAVVNWVSDAFGPDTAYHYPKNLKDWSEAQVSEGVQYAMECLMSHETYAGEFENYYLKGDEGVDTHTEASPEVPF